MRTHVVKKFILHTNFPCHNDFNMCASPPRFIIIGCLLLLLLFCFLTRFTTRVRSLCACADITSAISSCFSEAQRRSRPRQSRRAQRPKTRVAQKSTLHYYPPPSNYHSFLFIIYLFIN
jgi:hypothetical protein